MANAFVWLQICLYNLITTCASLDPSKIRPLSIHFSALLDTLDQHIFIKQQQLCQFVEMILWLIWMDHLKNMCEAFRRLNRFWLYYFCYFVVVCVCLVFASFDSLSIAHSSDLEWIWRNWNCACVLECTP